MRNHIVAIFDILIFLSIIIVIVLVFSALYTSSSSAIIDKENSTIKFMTDHKCVLREINFDTSRYSCDDNIDRWVYTTLNERISK